METANRIVDALLLLFYTAFYWAPPVVGLTVLSVGVGLAMLWVMGKTSNQAKLRKVKRALSARLLELRLYVNDPVISLRTQVRLLAANFRYLTLALRPALVLAPPIYLLTLHLEAFYERAPLRLGDVALLKVRMSPHWDPNAPSPRLEAPPALEVLLPPVRSVAAREVTWRIRPVGNMSGPVTLHAGGEQLRKRIEAGEGQRYVSGAAVSGYWTVLTRPGPRIYSPLVESIEIQYPQAPFDVLGIRMPWLAWFFAISILTVLGLRKRFGVVL